MNKFHIRSLLLGIGIGIVLTSLTGIIHSAGMNPEMSREEIITKAKQYGMVSSSDLIQTEEGTGGENPDKVTEQREPQQNEADQNEPEQNQPIKNTPEVDVPQSDNPEPAKPVVQEVRVRINPGDSSEIVALRLYNAGAIESMESFLDQLRTMNLQGSIQIGEFVINKGTDNRSIARIICGLVIQ